MPFVIISAVLIGAGFFMSDAGRSLTLALMTLATSLMGGIPLGLMWWYYRGNLTLNALLVCCAITSTVIGILLRLAMKAVE